MRAVIFGAQGQDGVYLHRLLQQQGIEVQPVGRTPGPDGLSLTDFDSLCRGFSSRKPDYVFHLAANSTTRHEALFDNHESIGTGSLNLLEAVRRCCPEARLFLSGSGLQFQNTGHPIHEQDPFDARDPYSASRIYSVYAARYFRRLGLKVYVGYLFNHDSPLRSERHMSRKIIEAARRIRAGRAERLSVGDPDVVKEWGFAGDMVEGIWTLVNQDTHTEAVIGTGKGYSIREWLECCFSAFGLHWEDHVDHPEGFQAEYRSLVSRPDTLLSLGWSPRTSFHELCQIMKDAGDVS